MFGSFPDDRDCHGGLKGVLNRAAGERSVRGIFVKSAMRQRLKPRMLPQQKLLVSKRHLRHPHLLPSLQRPNRLQHLHQLLIPPNLKNSKQDRKKKPPMSPSRKKRLQLKRLQRPRQIQKSRLVLKPKSQRKLSHSEDSRQAREAPHQAGSDRRLEALFQIGCENKKAG